MDEARHENDPHAIAGEAGSVDPARTPVRGAQPMTATPVAAPRGGMPLHWKMLIGFMAGLGLGLVAHYTAGADAEWVQGLTKWVTQPIGTLFLKESFGWRRLAGAAGVAAGVAALRL